MPARENGRSRDEFLARQRSPLPAKSTLRQVVPVAAVLTSVLLTQGAENMRPSGVKREYNGIVVSNLGVDFSIMAQGQPEAFSGVLIDRALAASGWNLLDPQRDSNLHAGSIPIYPRAPLNVQAQEGCVVAYNQHHPRGPWHAPRYHVAGRVERWI
jgi:hypothetical protein